MNDPATIHIVDDDAPFRRAIARVLDAAGYASRSYASAGEFLLDLDASAEGCLLLDMSMPGPSGLELQQALLKRGVALPVVFLTGHGDIPSTVQAMKAGAIDYLTKPVERERLLAAVRAALERARFNQTERARHLDVERRFERLSRREVQVMHAVVAGRLNKQIADDLGMAERTVKAYRAQVMRKMEVRTLAELVRVAQSLPAFVAKGP
jgi:FixJ family two-component response regulator